jgi:hypothetical protein
MGWKSMLIITAGPYAPELEVYLYLDTYSLPYHHFRAKPPFLIEGSEKEIDFFGSPNSITQK